MLVTASPDTPRVGVRRREVETTDQPDDDRGQMGVTGAGGVHHVDVKGRRVLRDRPSQAQLPRLPAVTTTDIRGFSPSM